MATVSSLTDPPSNSNNDFSFRIGQLVSVDWRTRVGVNKSGGPARILDVQHNDSTLSVQYLLDRRREQHVLFTDVQPLEELPLLRNRNMLLGRCPRCGSLQTDCQSCYITVPQQAAEATNTTVPKETTIFSSSSDSSDLEQALQDIRRYERFKRVQRKQRMAFVQHLLRDDDDSSTTSTRSDDDVPLQHLVHASQAHDDQIPWYLSLGDNLSSVKRRGRNQRQDREKSSSSSTQHGAMSVSSQGSVESSSDGSTSVGNRAPAAMDVCDTDSDNLSLPGETPPPEDGDFIQPEGNAYDLPSNVRDETENLLFEQLGDFFDRRVSLLEKYSTAWRKTVADLEQRLQTLSDDDDDGRRTFAKECFETRERFVDQLVRKGLDQCVKALTRLSSNSAYRKVKDSLPPQARDRRLEARGFRLDAVDESTQLVHRQLVLICRQAKALRDEAVAVDGAEYDADDDEGWAVPSSRSPVRADTQTGVTELGIGFWDSHGDFFDPHMHARRKRRNQHVVSGRKRKKSTKNKFPTRRSDAVKIKNVACEVVKGEDRLRHASMSKRDRRKIPRDVEARRSLQRIVRTGRQEEKPESPGSRPPGLNSAKPSDDDCRDLQETLFQDLRLRSANSSRALTEDPGVSSERVNAGLQSLETLWANAGSAPRGSGDTNERSVLMFQTLFVELEGSGQETLCSALSAGREVFSDQIRLLASILRLIELGANLHLKPDHGLIYQVFAPDRTDVFLSLVLIQFVDSVYSLVHPCAWRTSRLKNRLSLLKAMEPLRAHMWKHMDLLDRVTQCITKDLKCQEWRVSLDGKRAFVSSVDPKFWRLFLTTGRAPSASHDANPRFQCFKQFPVLPRSEVDALWRILAFVSNNEACSSSANFWAIVSKVFSHGSMARATENEAAFKPSAEQLSTLCLEVQYVVEFILGGSVLIPSSDNFLKKLLVDVVVLECNVNASSAEDRAAPASPWGKNDLVKFWSNVGSSPCGTESKTLPVDICALATELMSLQPASSHAVTFDVVPRTVLLRSCLALVMIWMNKAGHKGRARRNRLDNAVDMVVKMLKDEAQRREAETHASSHSFEAIFLGSRSQTGGLHVLEAAGYILIFAAIARESMNTDGVIVSVMQLSTQIWELLADGSMEARRARLEEPGAFLIRCEGPCADGLRLESAARVLGFFMTVVLGTLTSSKEGLAPNSYRPLLVSKSDDENALPFTFSCLLACLSSASELDNAQEIITKVTVIMGPILARIKMLQSPLVRDHLEKLAAHIECFRSQVLRLTAIPFYKCYRVLVTSSRRSEWDDLCFHSLLSLLRGVLVIAKCDSNDSDIPGRGDFEGFFRSEGVDDDSRAALQIRNEASGGLNKNSDALFSVQDVWNVLWKSVDNSPPSKQFMLSIPPAHSTVHHVDFSSEGRILIGRNISVLCGCLVALAPMMRSADLDQIASRKNVFSHPDGTKSDEDSHYYSEIRRSLSRELLVAAKTSSRLRKVVVDHYQNVLYCLLEQLLDTRALRKLPSCNLSRICAKSGQVGERREFAALLRATETAEADCSSITTCWGLAKMLGGLLEFAGMRNGTTALLLRGNGDVPGVRFSLSDHSLEKECLNIFRFVHEISSSSSNRKELFVMIMRVCSRQVSRLCKKCLQYEAFEGAGLAEHKGARLFEFYSCYVALFVSSLVCTLCDMSRGAEDRFQKLWIEASELILLPVLRKEQVDLRHAADALTQGSTSGTSEPCTDIEVIFNATVRRSRELCIVLARCYAATDERAPIQLLSALIDAAISGNTRIRWLFSRSLCSNAYSRTYRRDRDDSTVDVPFDVSVDNYLKQGEDARLPEPGDQSALLKLKRHAVLDLLTPRLRHQGNVQLTVGVLHVLCHLLTMEHGEPANGSVMTPRFSSRDVSIVGRGIYQCLQMTLASPAPSDDVVAALYKCATSLVSLPTSSVMGTGSGWLIDSLTSSESEEATTDFIFLQKWTRWLTSIASVVTNRIDPSAIDDCRNELRLLRRCEQDSSLENTNSVNSWRDLRSIENKLWPVRPGLNSISNVYNRSTKTTRTEEKEKLWRPSSIVMSAVQIFLTRVDRA